MAETHAPPTTNTGKGMHLFGDRNIITNNDIEMALSDSSEYGIYVASGADNNKGLGNTFKNCGTNISDNGTNNKINVMDGGSWS